MLKTDFMVIGSRQRVASLEEDNALSLLDTEFEKVNSDKCLGVSPKTWTPQKGTFICMDNYLLCRQLEVHTRKGKQPE